jgi:hypothetical protein
VSWLTDYFRIRTQPHGRPIEAPRSVRRLAAVALTLAILWGFGLLSFLGLILGGLALLRAHQGAGADTPGHGMAVAAVAVGTVGVVVAFVLGLVSSGEAH